MVRFAVNKSDTEMAPFAHRLLNDKLRGKHTKTKFQAKTKRENGAKISMQRHHAIRNKRSTRLTPDML